MFVIVAPFHKPTTRPTLINPNNHHYATNLMLSLTGTTPRRPFTQHSSLAVQENLAVPDLYEGIPLDAVSPSGSLLISHQAQGGAACTCSTSPTSHRRSTLPTPSLTPRQVGATAWHNVMNDINSTAEVEAFQREQGWSIDGGSAEGDGGADRWRSVGTITGY